MIKKLIDKIKKTNAPVVVGLDPMLSYVPGHIQQKAFKEYGETLKGAAEAIFMVGANGIGISGLPLAALTTNIPMYLTGLFISYIAGFVITWLAGFDDPMDDVNSASSAKEQ